MAASSPSGVMVDSCVLLDVITADSQWETWSAEHLARCLTAGPVAINAVIYGEVAFAYERIEVVDEALPRHITLPAGLSRAEADHPCQTSARSRVSPGSRSAPSSSRAGSMR